jgi:hypothetical protein
MIAHANEESVRPLFQLSFGKRPASVKKALERSPDASSTSGGGNEDIP